MVRIIKNSLLGFWYFFSSFLVSLVVLFFVVYIFIKGSNNLSLNFILDIPKGTPLGVEGGIFPAIMGSLCLTLLACISASLLGISTAIYIIIYSKKERLNNLIRIIVNSIAGIPSIVLGLFGYSFLVYFCKFGVSLLSGGITLGIMIFPFIEVVAEKAIREVDRNLILSSYALGINKSHTFFYVIWPECKGDIISSVIISGGFAMGAAAPVMLTSAVVFAPNPDSLMNPVMALPYHLYILVSQGISIEKAYSTALVMIIMLIILNFTAVIFSTRKRG